MSSTDPFEIMTHREALDGLRRMPTVADRVWLLAESWLQATDAPADIMAEYMQIKHDKGAT